MTPIRSAFRSVHALPRVAGIVVLATVALAVGASAASASQVLIVSQGAPPATYPHYVH